MPRRRKTPSTTGQVAPGRAYGARSDSEAAMAALPIEQGGPASSAGNGGQPGGQAGGPAGGAPAEDPMADALAAAGEMEPPGEGLLRQPPENPGDVTSGLAIGPGPGPEALSRTQTGPDPALQLWASRLPQLAIMASQPSASPEVRQLYRRVRSMLPPDVAEQDRR